MSKKTMQSLRGKSESELEKLYIEANTSIGKIRPHMKGELKNVQLPDGYMKEYKAAKLMRARVLTILNQKRNQRMKL
jgi:ribosomal protein L29